MVMAIQIPITPRPNVLARIKLKPIRHTHMDIIDITMVYLTSLAARIALGSVKEAGQIIEQQIL